MTADKDALLREALEYLRELHHHKHYTINHYGEETTVACPRCRLSGRITAALAEKDEDGWLPMSGKYAGEIWRHHPSLRSPDGRVWPEALETVNVLVQRPRYLEAQIARLWLDAERNIQTSFPCGDAIRWRPLPPLPKGE